MKKLSLFAAGLLGGIVAASAVQAQVIGIAIDQQGSLGYNTGQAVAKIATQEAGLTARIQPLAGTAAYLLVEPAPNAGNPVRPCRRPATTRRRGAPGPRGI